MSNLGRCHRWAHRALARMGDDDAGLPAGESSPADGHADLADHVCDQSDGTTVEEPSS